MRLGIGGDLVVDPVEASLASPRDLMVIDLLHDGLTRLDEAACPQPALADGVGGERRSRPRSASTSIPTATFASGRPVTPEDVIASLERVIAAGDTSLAGAVARGGHAASEPSRRARRTTSAG